jgi:hypothetical protein
MPSLGCVCLCVCQCAAGRMEGGLVMCRGGNCQQIGPSGQPGSRPDLTSNAPCQGVHCHQPTPTNSIVAATCGVPHRLYEI